MNFKLHHVTLSVQNLKISENFYSFFGFKRIYYWRADDKSLEIVHLKSTNGIILEMFCYASPTQVPAQSQNLQTDLPEIGVKHFALNVESLEKAKEDILKKGIEIAVDITKGRTEIDYFFIKDPDGILVEIVQDNRGL